MTGNKITIQTQADFMLHNLRTQELNLIDLAERISKSDNDEALNHRFKVVESHVRLHTRSYLEFTLTYKNILHGK